jgi:hypothetical protein
MLGRERAITSRVKRRAQLMTTGPARVTVVTASACHLCDQAQDALSALAQEYPLTVRVLDAASESGQVLLGCYGAGLFPLVLVDGEFFSAGRLPRRKLARLLAVRTAGAA